MMWLRGCMLCLSCSLPAIGFSGQGAKDNDGTEMTRIMNREKNGAVPPQLTSVAPAAALPGGEIELQGANLGPVDSHMPTASVDHSPAQVLLSRSRRMVLRVPEAANSGEVQIRQGEVSSNTLRLKVAQLLADDVHAVGNPAIDV